MLCILDNISYYYLRSWSEENFVLSLSIIAQAAEIGDRMNNFLMCFLANSIFSYTRVRKFLYKCSALSFSWVSSFLQSFSQSGCENNNCCTIFAQWIIICWVNLSVNFITIPCCMTITAMVFSISLVDLLPSLHFFLLFLSFLLLLLLFLILPPFPPHSSLLLHLIFIFWPFLRNSEVIQM